MRVFFLEKIMSIKLEDLKDREIYKGDCRNASKAMWIAEVQKFIIVREKFGYCFLEDVAHPELDDGYDLFITDGETVEFDKEEKEIISNELARYIDWLKKQN
jgi:hypothetical protein